MVAARAFGPADSVGEQTFVHDGLRGFELFMMAGGKGAKGI